MPIKKYYRRHPEYSREYQKNYIEKLKIKNPEKFKEYQKKRSKYMMEYQNKPEQRFKFLARQMLNHALRTRKITQQPCQIKQCPTVVTEAHHNDYTRPLDVTWFCRKHHREFHNKVLSLD